MQECQHVYKSDPNKKCPYPGYYRRWKLELPIDKDGECLFHSKDYDFKKANNFVKQYETFIEKQNEDGEVREIILEDVIFYGIHEPHSRKEDKYKYNKIEYLKSVIFDHSGVQLNEISKEKIRFTSIFLIVEGIFLKNVTIQNTSRVSLSAYDIEGSKTATISISNIYISFHLYGFDINKNNLPFKEMKLRNLDLDDTSQRGRNFLLDLYKQGRADIDDTVIWPKSLLALKHESDQKSKRFDLSKPIPVEFWDYFGQYLMGFKNFVSLAKGKEISIEIKVMDRLEVTIYSDAEEDLEFIEKDLSEFLNNILIYQKQGKPEVQFKGDLDKNAAILFIGMAANINSLTTQVALQNTRLESKDRIIIDLKKQVEEYTSQINNTLDGYAQINSTLLEYHKPRVFLEGETDEKLFQKAIELLGEEFPILLEPV